ncbi:MAG TPA: DNA-directed RNA polymerase subunit beta', partial [Clostridiales bacterium]|nr:DNA-directed RNA polymerase subunit beta' [Clostridiales bacterium]
GPNLKLHQCGLPKEMALELFKPFVMKRLVQLGHAHNVKSAKRMVERVRPEVWGVVEEVIRDHPVLLNRAPTLHRLGIQAFEPVLVEGRAIQIHPLVCTAYNADFDGDQMAVHVPLSAEAQAEARILMLSAHNILNPKDGMPVVTPTQDMVLGCYYLTVTKEGGRGEGAVLSGVEEVELAYEAGALDLHSWIEVGTAQGRKRTTAGRVILNEALPEGMRFVNEVVDRKILGQIVARCYRMYGSAGTAPVLDSLKQVGFRFATQAGATISVTDIDIPPEKGKVLEEADRQVEEFELQYRRGLITEEERYLKIIEVWNGAKDLVTERLMSRLGPFNPVYMMAASGARGNVQQISQLAGMRGLMADPSGRIIELPIRANFREGLNVLEYFTSTHGTRKGLADTALRTADSGYLTRRLVDVSQDVIIREEECGTTSGIRVAEVRDGSELIESLVDRVIGRTALTDILHPDTAETLVAANQEIDEAAGVLLEAAGVREVEIRSVFTCKSRHGLCIRCYGRNLATGKQVEVGEAVGIVAAQSIGEPGTQLTMRTFHTGGVAGEDITHGLPRVEELFEARKPKGQALIADLDGTVHFVDTRGRKELEIRSSYGDVSAHPLPFTARMKVREGDAVSAGQELTEGPVNPHDLLKIKGLRAVQVYLLQEVQRVYRLQGVDINDKHIEVIVRQMLRKVKVDDPGDADLLPGSLIDLFDFENENERVLVAGGQPAVARPQLLGITKASLATDSFLSAASFQETTRVLTEAALKGRRDPLLGLKENVIIGKLIPAGTGMDRYRALGPGYDELADEPEDSLLARLKAPDPAGDGEPEVWAGDASCQGNR